MWIHLAPAANLGNGWPVGGKGGFLLRKKCQGMKFLTDEAKGCQNFFDIQQVSDGKARSQFFFETRLLRFNFRWLGPNISNIFNIFTLCRWCWMSTVAKNRRQHQHVSMSPPWGFQLGSAQPIYYMLFLATEISEESLINQLLLINIDMSRNRNQCLITMMLFLKRN